MDVRRLATVLYFTDFALLSGRQSGYRPGHNTQLQLMYLTDKRYDSLDKERDLTTIYLDIISFFTQKWNAEVLKRHLDFLMLPENAQILSHGQETDCEL